jgi:hypothetical protein
MSQVDDKKKNDVTKDGSLQNDIPYFTGYKAILFFLTLTSAPIIVLRLFYVLKPRLPLLIIKT